MTNGEKFKDLIKKFFNVELSVYGNNTLIGCKFIKCPMPAYCERCSECEYKGFWEQEYDDSQEIQLITELELMKFATGLCRTEKEIIDGAINYIDKGTNDGDE